MLLSGCTGFDETPRTCPNGWVIFDFTDPDGNQQWYIETEPGTCTRAQTSRHDLRFFSDESCSDASTCAVVVPGESLVVAGPQLPSGTLGSFDTRPLRADGSCPLDCD